MAFIQHSLISLATFIEKISKAILREANDARSISCDLPGGTGGTEEEEEEKEPVAVVGSAFGCACTVYFCILLDLEFA